MDVVPKTNTVSLRDVASEFAPLSLAEARLLDAIPTGAMADCTELPGESQVRAALIRWLCITPAVLPTLTPAGLLLHGASVTGTLDLSFVTAGFPIALVNCKFPGGIKLLFAELRAFNLNQTESLRIEALGLTVRDDLFMNGLVAAQGVDLHNARIGGDLRLDGAKLIGGVLTAPSGETSRAKAIWAENASIGGNAMLRRIVADGCIQFMNARIGGNFECYGSTITLREAEQGNALWLERAQITGHALLGHIRPDVDRLQVKGTVNLLALELGGNLECDGARFENAPDFAILAERLRVKGSVFLRNGFSAIGGVHLLLAEIDGNLDCGHASMRCPLGRALSGDGAKIGGVLGLGPAFAAEGEVVFTAATIGVSVTCVGSFRAPGTSALSLSSSTIADQVSLGPEFESQGAVELIGTKIGGNVHVAHATLTNPGGVAFGADAAQISSSVLLGPAVKATGVVRLLSAKLELNFTCDHSVLCCPGGYALALQGIRIKGNLSLGQGCAPEGAVDLSLADVGAVLSLAGADMQAASLDLSAAHAGGLLDMPASWPPAGMLYLEGFTYDRLLAPPFDGAARLTWLRRQIGPAVQTDSLRSQPYKQIAKVLREQGYDSAAVDVLIGLQDDRRRHGGLSRASRFGLWVLKFTTGYGYKPQRALWYIGGFVVAGYLIFGTAWQSGQIVPTSSDAFKDLRDHKVSGGYEGFCALTYAVDVFVPIIDLGQRSKWHPISNSLQAITAPAPQGGILCDGLPAPLGGPPLWFVRTFRWLSIVSGWLFSSLLVAAVSGIVRKS
jgi:hypothetical protein